MTRQEFGLYLEEINRRAAPYPVLLSCHWCGRPIEEEFVLIWQAGKPHRVFHPDCQGDR